jgi:hypothetical protein
MLEINEGWKRMRIKIIEGWKCGTYRDGKGMKQEKDGNRVSTVWKMWAGNE